MRFDGPIPGQSLASTPKNAAWERPPATTDPDEAVTHHLTRLGQPEVMNHVLDAVAGGMPVSMITDLLLTGAVAKGIHNIDMSMMVAPIVHDYIVTLLDEEGVEYKEFFDKDKDNSGESLATSMALTNLREKSPELDSTTEELVEEEVIEEPKPKRGLIARPEPKGEM